MFKVRTEEVRMSSKALDVEQIMQRATPIAYQNAP
jgi:hypothetical protein